MLDVRACYANHESIDFNSESEKSVHNYFGRMNGMRKKALIVVSLVEESAEKANEEIEREIMDELSKHPPKIPWMEKVEKVTVTEA